MKRFHFHLESALGWRRQREQAERLRLEELNARRAALVQRSEHAGQEWEHARGQTLALPRISPQDLESLDRFGRAVTAEKRRLANEIGALDEAIAKQQALVIEATRQTRLLEKLRERKLAHWQADYNKQLEAEATESFLAKWGQDRE